MCWRTLGGQSTTQPPLSSFRTCRYAPACITCAMHASQVMYHVPCTICRTCGMCHVPCTMYHVPPYAMCHVPYAGHWVVQVLQLGNNGISSISSLQLSCLVNLRTLFLQNNDIARVDGLEGLLNLQVRAAGGAQAGSWVGGRTSGQLGGGADMRAAGWGGGHAGNWVGGRTCRQLGGGADMRAAGWGADMRAAGWGGGHAGSCVGGRTWGRTCGRLGGRICRCWGRCMAWAGWVAGPPHGMGGVGGMSKVCNCGFTQTGPSCACPPKSGERD